MNHEVIIRKANLDDAYNIAKAHVETWQSAYKSQMSENYLNNLSVDKRALKWVDILTKDDPAKRTFVAESDGKIVGFCSVGPTREIEPSSETIAELYAIYVDHKHAGKGVGSKLMEESLGFLKSEGYNQVTLRVLETNKDTRNFYENKGWVPDGDPKYEVIDGQDVVDVRYRISLI